MIGDFHEVLNFDQLILTLNRFICNKGTSSPHPTEVCHLSSPPPQRRWVLNGHYFSQLTHFS